MQLNKLNLNLLRALNALLVNKNVTLAAKHIGVSQSTMSQSLKQLRGILCDPLLVQGQFKRMQLTPLACSLIERVREIMSQIDEVFSAHTNFDVSSSQRVFRVGMTDLVALNLLQPLLLKLEKEAPSIKLSIHHPNYLTSVTVFEKNQYDLLLGMFENEPQNLKQQQLFTDDAVIVCCKNHPIAQKNKVSFDDLLKFPLVQFSLEGTPFENYTHFYLKKFNLSKQVNVTTGQALTSIVALHNTHFMTLTIHRSAEKFQQAFGLKIIKPSFKTEKFICKQYWHPKDDNDPAHQWLRTSIKDLSREV